MESAQLRRTLAGNLIVLVWLVLAVIMRNSYCPVEPGPAPTPVNANARGVSSPPLPGDGQHPTRSWVGPVS